MEAQLLYENANLASRLKLPWNISALQQDLSLDPLFKAMADNDEFVYKIVKDVIFSGVYNDIDTILYRQQIIKDCNEIFMIA